MRAVAALVVTACVLLPARARGEGAVIDGGPGPMRTDVFLDDDHPLADTGDLGPSDGPLDAGDRDAAPLDSGRRDAGTSTRTRGNGNTTVTRPSDCGCTTAPARDTAAGAAALLTLLALALRRRRRSR